MTEEYPVALPYDTNRTRWMRERRENKVGFGVRSRKEEKIREKKGKEGKRREKKMTKENPFSHSKTPGSYSRNEAK